MTWPYRNPYDRPGHNYVCGKCGATWWSRERIEGPISAVHKCLKPTDLQADEAYKSYSSLIKRISEAQERGDKDAEVFSMVKDGLFVVEKEMETMEAYFYEDDAHISIEEPFQGDSDSGFGVTCSITLKKKQAIAFAKWLLSKTAP